MSVAELQLKALADEVSEIEARILDRRIAHHFSLELVRMAPDETVIDELAQYAYSVETLCLAYRAVASVALERLAELHRRTSQQRDGLRALREAPRPTAAPLDPAYVRAIEAWLRTPARPRSLTP